MIMDGTESNRKQPQLEFPSLDAWRRLYDLASQVRKMEPWLWMEETDIFGVKDPDSDTVLFVSVMGLLGEYLAVALYLGAKAVTQFWKMQEMSGNEEIANMLFDIRQIHAAFGKKGELEPQEKRIVKELGLTFKGANAWPYFRSYRPGYFPWVVDAGEARWLTLALEQLLDVAPRLQKDRRLLGQGGPEHRYLVRIPSRSGAKLLWQDTHQTCPPSATIFHISVPNALLDVVRAMAPTGLTFELDVMPSPFPVGKRGERPQMPYLMMAVDSESGFILGVELLTVEGAIEDIWAQVPAKFLEMVRKNGLRPRKIAMRTPWVAMVMQGMCKELGIEIKSDPKLRALTQARRDMERFNRH